MLFVPLNSPDSGSPSGVQGVALLCSPPCLAYFLRAVPPWQLGDAPCNPRVTRRWETAWCQVCATCGLLIGRPKECILHGRRCPPSDWLRTVDAVTFAVDLGELLGGRAVPDEAWELAATLATGAKVRPAPGDVARAVARHLTRNH